MRVNFLAHSGIIQYPSISYYCTSDALGGLTVVVCKENVMVGFRGKHGYHFFYHWKEKRHNYSLEEASRLHKIRQVQTGKDTTNNSGVAEKLN